MTPGNELKSALLQCSGALLAVGFFSGVVNVLGLTGSLYMLQVYDRVLPSRSVPTLVGITVIVIWLYAMYGLLDLVRIRLLIRIGNTLDRKLHQQAFAASLLLPLRAGHDGKRNQPIRDLDQIRNFVSGTGPTAFFDLPWIPVYLVIIWFLHPFLGILATGGAVVIVLLTLVAEGLGRAPSRRVTESVIARTSYAEASRRNAEAIRAMGLSGRFGRLWSEQSLRFLRDQRRVSDVVSATGALSRSLRMALQSLMLGLGAWLVIEGEASSGVIIASSIMLTRSLAPVDVAIANWRGFLSARQSYGQLSRTLKGFADLRRPMALPRPRHVLSVEGLAVAAPGQQKPLIQNVTFVLRAGAGFGVIGPSASGKSTLVRAIVGAWPTLRGTVRLDHAALDQWDAEALGRDIGYLPQDVELFDGTVAENICRFDRDADPKDILAAAQAAGVDRMILRLADGFQTTIGEGGTALSAGQRQLVGLARALYGEPFLVVLDEPNSNLDSDGDVSLATAIQGVRQRGGIVIVIAHRPSALVNLDQLLVMAGGTMQAFGQKDEVLATVTRAAAEELQPVPDPVPAKRRQSTVVPLHERR
ncbi:type I secretion system permease/ATPase [Mesorhizobium sp.]|uniref:type I secretion system permease/ATPase n=1 Tax=Mesorhizobium sp. TaxID=1871066 RepID=UPI000FE3AEFA|nr:type I secretion system permease/ATPase [Mesorhizobium sp.]RWA59275.1 MAG: type I secretion system permease/ATPase [Mesorhizobium sp.]RWG76534.1 MAG: type I secretion system permease/ATPase [Mesorhizobium sp.]RWG77290.1 MAG: type I secretion system permease/ATPase [Mesorhizobium sp.]RWK01153.1 MAG: type I secretion system permease/ATPase [Mesorhizobium sp.]RWK13506.1 MAG: type I secretion system permease/ATPase [Mesorhizobium sp.]